MKNNLIKYIIFIFCISLEVYASCPEILKLEVSKRLGEKVEVLFGENAIRLRKIKLENLEVGLAKIGNYEEIMSRRIDVIDRQLILGIESGYFPNDIAKALDIVRKSVNNPKLIKEWASYLYNILLVETYISGTKDDIAYLEKEKVLPEKVALKVMLEMGKDAGFSTEVEDLIVSDKSLSEQNFMRLLNQKKMILDLAFFFSDHGHLIHLFQLNYLIYVFKKENYDPLIISKMYEWLGLNKLIYVGDITPFNPLLHGWRNLFDSMLEDFTSPEKLNPVLTRFFGLDFELLFFDGTL